MQGKRANVNRGSLFYIPSTSSGATFNLWHVGRLFQPSKSTQTMLKIYYSRSLDSTEHYSIY